MSEHIKNRGEHAKTPEHIKVDHEHHEKAQQNREKAAEHAKRAQSEVNLAALRETAKIEADSQHDTAPDDQGSSEPDALIGVQQTLKTGAYRQSLRRVQQKLPKTSRAFSKVVHSQKIEALSAVGAQTVARPSGLLGGSMLAFFGSTVLLYSAKHYGFTYNYLAFFMLFITGFLVGAAIELIIWAVHTRKHRY